jgi:predicted dehydrogenase
MNVLVVGYGLIGKQRVQALTRNPAVSAITVYDPAVSPGHDLSAKARSSDQAAAFVNRYDAAVVAAPHDIAVELLPRVLGLARAVLTEKPLGRSAEEAARLLGCAQELGSRLFVGFNYRFLKNVDHARRILAGNEFGQVLAVDAVLGHGAQPGYEDSWKTDRTRCGGGVCIDPGVHLFDLFLWLFGGLELLGGALGRNYWPIQVEDHASLAFSLPNGAVASVFLSLSSWQSRFEITIEAERAQLALRGRGRFYGPQRLAVIAKWPWLQPDRPRETEYNYGVEDLSIQEETDEFLLAIEDSRSAIRIATAYEALHAMQIVDACYKTLPSADRAAKLTAT